MNKVLITGGSGLIGTAMTKLLTQQGFEVAWLSRASKNSSEAKIFLWNIETNFLDEEAIKWANIIIHLAGENIADKRWTPKRKRKIIESRTCSAQLLIEKIKLFPGNIKTVVAASAIGYYGDRKNEILNENAPAGSGFLSASVAAWENATGEFEKLNVRLVRLRIGVVLSEHGGAFKELMQLSPLRILPKLGKGTQIYSWIHIADVCGIILFAIINNLSGIYNAVAPKPVSQITLVKTIKNISGKFYLIVPAPALALKIYLGELSTAVLISQYVSSDKIQNAGYRFEFERIEGAIKLIIEKSKK
ncbi:MAG: TIGR01777 family oxidoreductase [Chitinophagales bacterium]